ncbi:MAG: bifunctional (p)ppGpp synthetase/guanosine-3',5'-bis(diphosphate) 3'-pyrophosphohydrolase [Gammaproteobacteria bacterium]|nr:bifunctional (p)ppGpp synthetase/guanosine-3',5'-bis(diphosphate) 3'-pyrophosphohydrolase [Gammaproteobacteria bacterium]
MPANEPVNPSSDKQSLVTGEIENAPHAGQPHLFGIDDLCKLCETRYSAAQIQEIFQAYRLAAQAHDGQRRKSGEDYIYHPIYVAKLVFELGMDSPSVIAAILHDVLEDTHVERHELVEQFGEPIAHMVDGLSKLENLQFEDRLERQAANFRKMVLAMVGDIRIIIIKLCDRVHNMRTLDAQSTESRRRIARETLDVYAPIAHRLGIETIKNELEDLGFWALYPARHRVIGAQIEKARKSRKTLISKIEIQLSGLLEDAKIEGKVNGREKHLYSLYQKMLKKQLAFKEVYDMFGLRILVNTVDECYRVLGLLHTNFTPRVNMFKDYVAIPKENGYQSLHTVLLSRDGATFEAQIRTHEMDQFATSGVASHWAYKSTESKLAKVDTKDWLGTLLDYQATANDTLEFYESVKKDLFPSEIYVYTPKGDIMRLPANATLVDFAFAVHSKVGKHCFGAQIDGRPSPLSTQLKSGQKVRILTKEFAAPKPEWLDFVVTAKARTAIKHYLRSTAPEATQAHGRAQIELALRVKRSGGLVVTPLLIERLLTIDKASTFEDLLLEVGLSNRNAQDVADALINLANDETLQISETADDGQLQLQSESSTLVTPAKCCLPIRGDTIQGVRTGTNQVTVHRSDCKIVTNYRKRPDLWVDLQWSLIPNTEFTTEITLEMRNQPGALASVSYALSRLGVNIENINFLNKGDQFAVLLLVITVTDRVHLARIIRKLRNTPLVNRVKRRDEN